MTAPADRLAALRKSVEHLPVGEDYRAALLASIETHRDQILVRPGNEPVWSDLELVQQITLGDAVERYLQSCRDSGVD